MFTKADYRDYFSEFETIFKSNLVVYTDILNEIDDNSLKNKLSAMAAEDMEAFEFINEEKERIF